MVKEPKAAVYHFLRPFLLNVFTTIYIYIYIYIYIHVYPLHALTYGLNFRNLKKIKFKKTF
jgi:hypothetical protein